MVRDRRDVDASDAQDEDRLEIVKEAATMGLYVAICLLAALAVAEEADFDHRRPVVLVIWGTTLGLALAHWFAFRLSARLVGSGGVRRSDALLAGAQLAGSVVVAVLATLPVVVFEGADLQLDATRWVVTAIISLAGFHVARSGGASRLRSAAYAAAITVVAFGIVAVKNGLAGH